MNDKLVVYTDGGARGNPGPAGIGFVIYGEEGAELKRGAEHIGSTTNNQAEYQALIKALNAAVGLNADTLECRLDSELVVKQLQGLYKVREEGLKPLALEVLALVKKFRDVKFTHVPREKNKLADELVNEALDKAGF